MSEEKEPIHKLTAREIAWLDEIIADQNAAEHALRIAITHYENRLNELAKLTRDFWDHLAEVANLNMDRYIYEIKNVDGAVCVVIKGKKK